jgi:hypothetical protein
MFFYDAVSRWKEIEPHLEDEEFQRVLRDDFNRFTWGRWRKSFPTKDRPLPGDWEGYNGHKGRYLGPEGPYRRYVLDLACYWLCNANLRLATLVLPNMKWRILFSRQNHLVWNGHDTLFDLTSQALYGDPWVAWEFAFGFGRELAPGEYLPVKYAEHFEIDLARQRNGTPYGRCPWCNELATGKCCPEYRAFLVDEVAA